ncbi:hypothetical protein [Methylocystis parvus]|uniref:hypothetical protein n=1 Tax=Methylocystis parvus TaxID=134 RepID=UPI003C70F558
MSGALSRRATRRPHAPTSGRLSSVSAFRDMKNGQMDGSIVIAVDADKLQRVRIHGDDLDALVEAIDVIRKRLRPDAAA